MEAKYTPGPWRAVQSAGPWRVFGPGDLGPLVADCYEIHDLTKEEVKANASLIAAAPELLEAAEEAIHRIDNEGIGGKEAKEKLYIAIRKARGEG